jgi:hypothetical protein
VRSFDDLVEYFDEFIFIVWIAPDEGVLGPSIELEEGIVDDRGDKRKRNHSSG